jgi:curved DNA-binding protein CbpA
MPIISYYDILGVKNSATSEDIAGAYRKKIKQWHPDICRLPQAEEKMKDVNEAAEVLLDPVRRREYDISLARELSLFRRAALWGREEQTKNARAHASSRQGFSSENIRTRRATAKKGGGIPARTIRFAAGYCAAGFIFFMLVLIGFTAITSLDVPAGVSSYSPMPSSITQAISSESTQPAIEKGNELFDAGDYEGALRMYDAVVAKNPDLMQKDVWYNRGIAQNALGHYGDASQSFDHVLALSPGDSLAVAQKGESLLGLGRYDKALDYTNQALAEYSDAAWIWNNRAVALTKLGQQKEARAAFDNARIFPSGRSGY